MPDYGKIKLVLEEKLNELESRAQNIDSELDVPGDDDWSESATESEGDQALEKVGTMTLETISKIKSALQKIEKGSFGKCSTCLKTINVKRLEALPYATQCVQCSEVQR